jgi:hypothetical protein
MVPAGFLIGSLGGLWYYLEGRGQSSATTTHAVPMIGPGYAGVAVDGAF